MNEEENLLRKTFSILQESGFVTLLRDGFSRFYDDTDPSKEGFGPAAPFVGTARREPSLVDDLEYIFLRLTPLEAQSRFRTAVRIVLEENFSNKYFPSEAILDLLYLLPRIKAFAALEVLPQLVTDGRPGQEEAWLLREAMGVAKSMLPAKSAKISLEAFSTSSIFQPQYTLDILTALCLSSQNDWLEPIRLMNGNLIRLTEIAKEEGLEEELSLERFSFVENLAHFIPLSSITHVLDKQSFPWMEDPHMVGATEIIRALLDATAGPYRVRRNTCTNDAGDRMLAIELTLKETPSAHKTIHLKSDSPFVRAMQYPFELPADTVFAMTTFAEVFEVSDGIKRRIGEFQHHGVARA